MGMVNLADQDGGIIRGCFGWVRRAAWPALLAAVLTEAGVVSAAVTMPEKLVDEPPVLTPAKVNVNRTRPQVAPRPTRPVFSAHPTVREIFSAPVFGEPLVPVGGNPTDPENAALAQALVRFADRTTNEESVPMTDFLRQHPLSPWSPAILCNLGLLYYHTGRFTQAMLSWERAWTLSKDSQEPSARALADRALGELAKMNARLGRFGRLELLFAEMGNRNVRGSATEKITGAKAGLWLMKNRPEAAFRCGPMALASIQSFLHPDLPLSRTLENSQSTQKGMSLTEIRALAQKIQLNLQMAKRDPGASLQLPAVIHWKVDHYAALLKQEGNRYLVRDPTFGEDLWVTQAALDMEASGYFLIPSGSLPAGWKTVGNAEGNLVFGKGNTGSSDNNGTSSGDHTSGGNGGCDTVGMPRYAMHSMLVSLNLVDIPVGTNPPRGPNAMFKVTYSQREANQPANFVYSNLGQKWTFGWMSYIVDDPLNLSADVSHYQSGGGLVYFKKYDSTSHAYAPETQSGSRLVRISTSPILYEQRLRDGGRQVYSVSDGETSFPRKVFLTKIFNPAGDSLTFTFDNALRLVSAQDALGQVTTLSYESGTDSLKITKVTDPFGRFATFEYNGSGQLKKITDVLGLASEFRYGSGDFIDSLITPYGNTIFSKGESGTNRWLEATDAIGQKERLEYKDGVSTVPSTEAVAPSGMNTYNSWMDYRSSYFWDKKAMQNFPGDFTKARIYHWLHLADINSTARILESEKAPLENRVWYNYTNQVASNVTTDSMSFLPSKIGRVLDDGSTQLFQNDFNKIGNLTKTIDPLGRETRYLYDTNLIDLISARQKKGATTELLDTITYNSIHLPLTRTNAAGQVSTYTYNSKGQLLTSRNPKGETTTFTYDSQGYLVKRQGALAGDSTRLTYDGYGRVRTTKDPDGHTLRFDYNALDQVTKISYPDSTYEQFVYHNLDLEKSRDRLGRWSKTFRNALQQPVAHQDPLQRLTNFVWCSCGQIKSLTDPEGNTTEWRRDLLGRVTDKIYPDGRAYHFDFENTLSRLLRRTDAMGQISQYEYFPDNALKQVSYTHAEHATPTVSYAYDSVYKRISTMTDGNGTTQFRYKPVGSLGALQVDSVDGPWSNDIVNYAYDSLGRVLTRTINGIPASTVYDSLGRMVSATNALGTFTYGYVGQTGRLDSIAYPNGQKTRYGYFPDSGDFRLQEVENLDPSSALLSKCNYTYDPQGQIRTWTRQFGTVDTTTYVFANDAADQLIGATLKNTNSGSIRKSFAYSYDKAGNRESDQQDSLVRQFSNNSLNQLQASQGGGKIRFEGSLNESGTLTVNGSGVPVATDRSFSTMVDVSADTNVVTMVSKDFSNNADTNLYQVVLPDAGNRVYTYDLNGNMTKDGIHVFEYDAKNRLTAIVNGTLRSEFQYDGFDRRVQITEKSSGAITSRKRLLWAGDAIVEERDSTGAAVTKQFFEGGAKDGAAKYFYTRDHLGSLREMVDSSGTVVARFDYDPYGTRERITGSLDADFGFTGHYFHSPSGLYLTKYRAYNSGIGRWISRDALGEGEGANLYGYVDNNPISNWDPLGLSSMNPGKDCRETESSGGGGGIGGELGPDGPTGGGLNRGSNPGLGVSWGGGGNRGRGENTENGPGPNASGGNGGKNGSGSKTSEGSKGGEPANPTPPPYQPNPYIPPTPDFKWNGRDGSKPGDKNGNWYNPGTGESYRNDGNHGPPIGPHNDYRDPSGNWYRHFPDGSTKPKP